MCELKWGGLDELWVESFALNTYMYVVHIFGKTPNRHKILVLHSTRDSIKYGILVGMGLGGQFLTLR